MSISCRRSITSLNISVAQPNLTVMNLVALQATRRLSVALSTFIIQWKVVELLSEAFGDQPVSVSH